MEQFWHHIWLIQGIGFIAFAADTALCHVKNGRKMLALSAPALLLWAVHYALLGGFTGALMCVATALRNIFTLACPPAAHRYIFIIGMGVISLMAVFSWQGPVSILPLLGSAAYCFSVLKPDCRVHVRLSWAASTFFWLLYGVAMGSWPEIAASMIGLGSVSIALIKQDLPDLRAKTQAVKLIAARYAAASVIGVFFCAVSISAAFFSTISTM